MSADFELLPPSPSPTSSTESLLQTSPPPPPTTDLRSKFPRLHRFLVYIRGPPSSALSSHAPPTACPPSLPFESAVIRLSRPFTSPWLLVVLVPLYISSLALLVRSQYFFTPANSFLDCTSSFWRPGNGCGMNGTDCAPFVSDLPFQFRCPAGCSTTILANIRAVGAQEVRWVPLVVGGGDDLSTYRGDSWVCPAAQHAGIISASKGGCGSLSLTGDHTNFLASTAHDLASTSFPSIFPLSYRFHSSTTLSHCEDLRDFAWAFNVFVTCLLFLVLRPKPVVLYWCIICIGVELFSLLASKFWHITFFSDPRDVPPPISDAFGSFLPTLFIAYAFYRCAFRHVLPSFSAAPLERALLYLPTFWMGVYFNFFEYHVPIDRLTADAFERPGALFWLFLIIALLVFIIGNQMRVIRETGWLPVYLGNYILGGMILIVLSLLPGLTLRIHHYIFPMMFMPGTAFPTRLSALYQTFLLGMFLNGVSRWGFDSILQTTAELRRDAPLGSSLPVFLTNSAHPLTPFNSTLFWSPISANLSATEGWTGFSLLIDDVERYAGPLLNYSVAALDWSIPHFFRLAYQRNGLSGDYTRAAIFWPNGTFVDPLPGPS
ncbi:hypothetical protein BOTBODRAFT_145116 [Botryobasidium botryosum FD-172 SS1]|uniref:LCCL domain-containing protein n=1 Tax=Botryobasidium botryosum (strain FD-172 SS1) TaxID=930990 RepID=A0A067MIK7_BOTB1|nr:hypothetical protein BOTBODRAFT_145116 [Botryobasidium botryosum FD-172 SS1]